MKRTLVVLAVVVGCEYEGGLLGEIDPRPSCSPDAFEFLGAEGAGTLDAKTLVLRNEGDTRARFTLEEDASWLGLSTYSPTSDGPDDDASVDVTPDLTGLSPGVYAATIWVRCGEWTEAVGVELVVGPGGSNVIYVSMDGDDSTGDGSLQNPYKTVTKGRDELLPPGLDTVYILPADRAYSASEGEALPIELVDGATVTAPGAEYVEISGEDSSGVFTVSSGQSSCVLSGLTVSKGSAAFGSGLLVANASSVTVTDCVFDGCAATNNGGAVRIQGGCGASFSRCAFRLNSAGADGGAVSDGAGAVYDDCVFEANTATDSGGGGACATGQFNRCSFSGNSAGTNGGGCFLGAGGTFQDCTLDSNVAGTNGGAIYAVGGALDVDGSLILSNSASNAGGGIYVSGGGTTSNSVIDSNTADDGGGIYVTSTSATITSNSIVNNVATASGGGVYLSGGGSVGDCVLESNTADVGGGLYVTSANNTFIGRSSIANNRATTSGGGVTFDNAIGAMGSMFHECDIRDNTAGVSGGGVFITGKSTVAMGPHHIVANSALSGGGIYIQNGQLGGQWDRFFRNNLVALNQGGGICYAAGSLDVEGCTVVDNDGDGLRNTSMAVGGLLVVNSVFWGNDDDLDSVLDAAVSYCDIGDGDDSADPTNLSVDPSFVDATGEDYHLTGASPCIDAGDNAADTGALDLDGNPRTVDGGSGTATVDMGCYEYQP